jgi:hypothetical protein
VAFLGSAVATIGAIGFLLDVPAWSAGVVVAVGVLVVALAVRGAYR